MPACYRLFRRKYSPSDARGAYLAGGRWNQPGVRMLDASSALSLACLEVLVHIKEPRLPVDYGWVKIEIPEDCLGAASDQFNPFDEGACKEFGSAWSRKAQWPAIKVPSIIIPTENNFLLNPEQPRFPEISFSTPAAFRFDPRLLKLGPILL